MTRNTRVTEPGYHLGRTPENAGKTYPPTLLTADAVRGLMNACMGGSAGKRNRALIAVLYRTGMLISEALYVELDDLDLTPGAETVRVRFPRLVQRTLALDAVAMSALEPWLTLRRTYPGTLVFCSAEGRTKGGPMGAPGFRGSLDLCARKAGLPNVRVHPHAFRHTLAAELMVEQWPLPYIMTQLGIATFQGLADTLLYLNIVPPPDTEILEIIRERPPMMLAEAP